METMTDPDDMAEFFDQWPETETPMTETGPSLMAQLFTDWAQREGLLSRITEEQCADLAKAFMAGWAMADAWRESGCAAGMETLRRLTGGKPA
jgi:hypothetical protein